MMNWLFGRKKKGGEKEAPKKNEEKKTKKKPETGQQGGDQWIYDALLQYLTSPLWKIPISMFMDENCLAFDDEEQNPFEYTEIHNNFKKMIEDMLDSLIIDIGITYDQFLEQVQLGMTIQEHKKIFEQLLVADNFIVFKKLLVKRNKELELEAVRNLQEEEKKRKIVDSNVSVPQVAEIGGITGERAQLESYEKELEHAIAMSLDVESERNRINKQEQEEFEKALTLSKIEYDRQQSKINEEQEKANKQGKEKEKQIEEEKKKFEKIEENRKKLDEEKKKMIEEQKKKDQSVAKQEQIVTKQDEKKEDVLARQEEEKKEQKNATSLGPLKQSKANDSNDPRIISSKLIESEIVVDLQKKNIQEKQEKKEVEEEKKSEVNTQFKPPMQYSVLGKEGQLPQVNPKRRIDPMTLDELMNERMALKEKLDAMKQEDDITKQKAEENKREEDLIQRKKRLQLQRDLILKKKKDEQEKELINYKMKQQLGMLGSLPSIGQQSLALGSQSIKLESEQDTQKEKNKQLMSKIEQGLKE